MEFEKVTVRALFQLGYPIFYTNLKILHKEYQLSEFDIISDNFIVEVKSGRDVGTKGLFFLKNHNMLPKGYIIYVYCPFYSNQQVKKFNKESSNCKIIYINDLRKIARRHKPSIKGIINDEETLRGFLRHENFYKFDKVYMGMEMYNLLMSFLVYRKYKPQIEYMLNFGKIGVLEYMDEESRSCVERNVPYLRCWNKSHKIRMEEFKPIEFHIYYDIKKERETKKTESKILKV